MTQWFFTVSYELAEPSEDNYKRALQILEGLGFTKSTKNGAGNICLSGDVSLFGDRVSDANAPGAADAVGKALHEEFKKARLSLQAMLVARTSDFVSFGDAVGRRMPLTS